VKFDVRDLKRVLEAFENSEWDEVHLAADGFELHLESGTAPSTAGLDAPPAPAPVPAPVEPPPVAPSLASPGRDPAHSDPPLPAASIEIRSPSVGIFWRSPSPGAPPFVEVGQVVAADETLCIVEVMKLMTPLKAEVAGEIARIHVANGDRLDKGQALFSLVPTAS
jgi:acetyl-CoA carboxylase biotin carboxyl carrier protein